MTALNRNGFRNLELDSKVTLIGQLLLTTGTAFLSLGQIFKLLKEERLPCKPIQTEEVSGQSYGSGSLYSASRSYFET